ncbi:hypothetical protein scyTo_0000969 [Scyliorhinus torazame]|uniref:Uncharacterized protein n=1 Tax=Scyliorhinus torazame TaxID=75743 RepID=A0A401P6Y1_SCYTO|nr:hypothetical protein [Scyliorhinus torazame]
MAQNISVVKKQNITAAKVMKMAVGKQQNQMEKSQANLIWSWKTGVDQVSLRYFRKMESEEFAADNKYLVVQPGGLLMAV